MTGNDLVYTYKFMHQAVLGNSYMINNFDTLFVQSSMTLQNKHSYSSVGDIHIIIPQE